MTRTAIVIIGMHRAGTSALARVCSLRGARLPEHLLPANAGNASGYWEPEAVVALNTRILEAYGLTWDDPWAAWQLPQAASIAGRFQDEARELVAREFGDAPLLVLKDPRCTLLLEFWDGAMRAAGISLRPVVIMRPWQDVVASLATRDVTSAASAGLLYVGHALAAARASARGASFITYAQLLADWRGTTDRIAGEQSFAWPGTDAGSQQVEAFLRSPAPHRAQPTLLGPLAHWADEVWQWCQAAAEGKAPPLASLAAVNDEFAAAGAMFAPLLGDRARRQRETESERDQALGERNAALEIYYDTEARLAQTQADLGAQRDRALELYQQADAQLQRTQDDYVARDRELSAQLATVLNSRSWALTRPLRALMRLLRRGDPLIVDGILRNVRQPRAHAGLRRFLSAEFGEATAIDVIARIEQFHLPIPGQQPAAMKQVDCSQDEAVAWAQAIALRAGQRPRADGPPDVSIVVPVYNQAPFTLACLDALMAHASRYRFEVLVGDDGSSDATAAALSVPIAGVRHVRHAQNLGFVRNCNATAAHAAGRHVLFLNNDTLVLPGWLDELIGTLDADPGIGLVGSKLVYPDGRMQECGAIVWRDGSAWNYGRLDDPRRPEFGYLRDVDYISGASIALRTGLWTQLGGFDELFVPAYAEDADLAFRVRAHGLRTVVQPLSQLLHFEGVTSGTDLGAGAKAYQVDNLRKLHARWETTLASHRDNAVEPELEKERRIARRALFIDHCTPTPDEDAGSLVAFEVMRAFLSNGYKVTFIPEDNFAHVGRHTRDLQRMGIEAIHHPAFANMRAFLSARKDPFDVIFLHRFGVAARHLDALRRAYPRARVVFLNADLHYLREMRQAELDADSAAAARARQTRDRELAVIGKVDVALVHSDHEQALLQRELPASRIVLFPLVHDPAAQVAPLSVREGVCFVGGFRHPPNADGIAWFVAAVWPLVLEQVPDARLYIVGSHMPPDVRALARTRGVEAVGFVDDLDGFLDRRRVSIAPLRYGAGAKGKVAGSLARGLPVVCTPVAAEGMGLAPDRDVLVGDSPQALARHVVTLLTDDARWRALSEAGLAYAHEVTSRASAHRRMRELLGHGQPAGARETP
ncbi:glycosyltransferase [Cognatiluteimonas telluris]|uniref:glycosyltransferase n=1 Tax=Cognatiluteimonas telluris TaxID=1104775 RepID=UPI001408290F|nr:glycosyltransferase [Lysobacter telluris]